MTRTLQTYIFNEIWPAFLVSLLVLVFIILATKMLSITEWVVTHGVRPLDILRLIFYLLPGIIFFALPAAGLIAVLVAFLRLSSDNEIIALQSSGISLYQMMPPVFALSLAGYLLASLIAFFVGPWGNRSFKDSIFMIAQSKTGLGIKERIFCEPFDNVTFYINSFSPKERIMKDVFVVDSRGPLITSTIVAKEGSILSCPKSRIIRIRLLKGTVFMVDKNFKSARTMKFETYNLNIGLNDIMNALASRRKAPKEMNIQELMESLNKGTRGDVKYNETLIELFEKFSIPLAVFLMGIIGAPLGAQLRARGRSMGIIIGLMIFIIYYMFLAGVRSICETGTISPPIGVWFPNLFLCFFSIYLLTKVANERPILILKKIVYFWSILMGEKKEMSREEEKEIAYIDACIRNQYIGNIRMNKFHRLDCKWVEKISSENKVLFKTREEALSQKYRPCKVCRP